MFYVYILKGPRNHLYTGVTKNIEKRIDRHKTGQGAEFTNRNKAYTLVFKEKFETYIEARNRERQIKGWTRKKKEKLIYFGKPIV